MLSKQVVTTKNLLLSKTIALIVSYTTNENTAVSAAQGTGIKPAIAGIII